LEQPEFIGYGGKAVSLTRRWRPGRLFQKANGESEMATTAHAYDLTYERNFDRRVYRVYASSAYRAHCRGIAKLRAEGKRYGWRLIELREVA
jgi:hypothetical protein